MKVLRELVSASFLKKKFMVKGKKKQLILWAPGNNTYSNIIIFLIP